MSALLESGESYSIQVVLRKTKAVSYAVQEPLTTLRHIHRRCPGELMKFNVAQTKDYDKAKALFEDIKRGVSRTLGDIDLGLLDIEA